MSEEKKSTTKLKKVLKKKITKSVGFKTEEQGNALRSYFLNNRQSNNAVFCDFDLTYDSKQSDEQRFGFGDFSQLKKELTDTDKDKDVYFRINIDNRHWIGCKISKPGENKKRSITVFDSSYHVTKDTKIIDELKEKIIKDDNEFKYNAAEKGAKIINELTGKNNTPDIVFESEVKVKQTVKNHNNNCVFESEMSMLLDAGVVESGGGYINSKKHLDMDKITSEIKDDKTLIKMKYAGNEKKNNKDKNLLLLITNNSDRISNFKIKDEKNNDINVTKIGTKYYVISKNGKACELVLKNGQYVKEKTFECDKEVFNYITENNNNIKLNEKILSKIVVKKQEIDKANFEEQLNKGEIKKTKIKGEKYNILKIEEIGNFVICDDNKVYRLKITGEGENAKYVVNKNEYFDCPDNELLNKIEKVKESDLDNIKISKYNIEGNLSYYDLNGEIIEQNVSVEPKYNEQDFQEAFKQFLNGGFLTENGIENREGSQTLSEKIDMENISEINQQDIDINLDEKGFIKIDGFLKLNNSEQKKLIDEHKVRYSDIVKKISEGVEIKLDKDSQEKIIKHFKKTSKEGKNRVEKYLLDNNENVKKAFSETEGSITKANNKINGR